jgi:hypothetical protein
MGGFLLLIFFSAIIYMVVVNIPKKREKVKGTIQDFYENMGGYTTRQNDMHMMNGYDDSMNHYNDVYNMQQSNEMFNQQALESTMDESKKIVTAFDHGGYVMGAGFNPSDTMREEAFDDMNHMNDMSNDMNNMNGF